jgi:biotin carboxyl carrier protein
MQYDVETNGRPRRVSIARAGGAFHVTLDGRDYEVDAARVDAYTMSLIVGEVRLKPDTTYATDVMDGTYEVTIAPDPATSQLAVQVGSTRVLVGLNERRRWSRKDESARSAAAGPQRIVSPMPGKIVRVLVRPGDMVRIRQPLVVVEAMKMENELRAGRDGIVAEIHAEEGQSVDAGALLIVVQ